MSVWLPESICFCFIFLSHFLLLCVSFNFLYKAIHFIWNKCNVNVHIIYHPPPQLTRVFAFYWSNQEMSSDGSELHFWFESVHFWFKKSKSKDLLAFLSRIWLVSSSSIPKYSEGFILLFWCFDLCSLISHWVTFKFGNCFDEDTGVYLKQDLFLIGTFSMKL